ncbi:hypothetical protein AAX26_01871 [Aliarcobacter thereius]|nr:hypothetical protein AAX26_01871 [Aliarcobacter thereius]
MTSIVGLIMYGIIAIPIVYAAAFIIGALKGFTTWIFRK